LLQDLVRWSGGVQSGHVSEQHVTSFDNRLSDVREMFDVLGEQKGPKFGVISNNFRL